MTTCCIFGLGYIGLPTAAVLASSGHNVIGVDTNTSVVDTVNKGLTHIVEPGLPEAVSTAVSNGSFYASSAPKPSDVFIIAVPTPLFDNQQSVPQPNLEYVIAAAHSISSVLRPGNLVLLESTSPVGTTQLIADLISNNTGLADDDFFVCYCPERVIPGKTLHELIHNDRVIGGLTPRSTAAGISFYQTFCNGTLHPTTSRSAELVKLAENSFRDVNIAFANELSLVCDRLNVDVHKLIALSNCHPRVNILQPGCGVGGHCIAVDPWFIASAAPDLTPLIQTARHVNQSKPRWVLDVIYFHVQSLRKNLDRPVRLACLGLAFKPDVDDLRESPALSIVQDLILSDLDVLISEPNLSYHPSYKLYSPEQAISQADIVVILVPHSPFKTLDFTGKLLVDPCGLIHSTEPAPA